MSMGNESWSCTGYGGRQCSFGSKKKHDGKTPLLFNIRLANMPMRYKQPNAFWNQTQYHR